MFWYEPFLCSTWIMISWFIVFIQYKSGSFLYLQVKAIICLLSSGCLTAKFEALPILFRNRRGAVSHWRYRIKSREIHTFRESSFHSSGKHHYFNPSTEAREVITSHCEVGIPLAGVRFSLQNTHCSWQCRLTPWRAAFPLFYSWDIYLFLILALL